MGTSVSRAAMAHVRTFAAAFAAFTLALALAPASALADDAQVESVAGPLAGPGYEGDAQSVSPDSDLLSAAEGPTLASVLAGSASSIVSADVALDAADPVVGSFTVDGLTYALNDGKATLVAVSSDLQQVTNSQDADDSRVAPMLASGQVTIPATVNYNGMTYPVIAIGPYAFYLSGTTSVELPASILSVDDRAFRSSDVACVEVAAGNPNLASFDGCLYDSQLLSLLLIPEGRAGAVLLPETAEVAEASKFSHCSLVDAISVEEDGAAFASWDGLLYDASGTTLLRVPAGATEITIRDGCATIAAGALEGCAKLERINAPATVTSISPDLFESVPTITLPAQMAVQDGTTSGVASSLLDQANASTGFAPQLTAMVAFSTTDDDLPEVDPSSIEVSLPYGADPAQWGSLGFSLKSESREATIQASTAYDAITYAYVVAPTTFVYNSNSNGSATSHEDASYGEPILVTSAAENYKWTGAYIDYKWNSVRRQIGVGSATSGVTSVYSSLHGYLEKGRTYYRNGQNETWYLNGTEKPVLTWEPNGGEVDPPQIQVTHGAAVESPVPRRPGYKCTGWYTETEGGSLICLAGDSTPAIKLSQTLYAQWKVCEIGFDTDSEPDDAGYPGVDKDPISAPDAVGPDGTIEIEDPKRPGYVFEGWVIPNADGTEAVDQDLVYQGDDGKWYVDASKLPDYADSDGKVELTARWTSLISVDVPSSVTFYADLVTQGQESREGATEGAFGQNKVANQSEVDLRVVGLESSAVKTEGSTLGADSILKKADAATPSTSTQKLLSLYPSAKQWTADELRDPDAVGSTKAVTAVDFDLDDILLEKSFKADDFTIAAGGTLNMGYRLNLTETGQQLDYDKLATLEEGQSASIANVSYTFAGDAPLGPTPSGDETDPLYVTVDEAFITANGLSGKAQPGTYGLADIKAAAEDIASKVTVQPPAAGATTDQVAAYWDTVQQQASQSSYYPLYKALLDAQVMDNGAPVDSSAPYFQLKADGVYLPLQLIGICQDTKSDGAGKAGLTFQMRDMYAYYGTRSTAAGGGTFDTYMNSDNLNTNGWGRPAHLRNVLTSTFWGYLPAETQVAIAPVDKFQQLPSGTTDIYLQKTTGETIWLPSMYEVFGVSFANYNESEALTSVSGYVPFQYMAYEGNAGSTTNTKAVKTYNGSAPGWWMRSAYRNNTGDFCRVASSGTRGGSYSSFAYGAAPCFCL